MCCFGIFSDEAHTLFIMSNQYSKEIALVIRFNFQIKQTKSLALAFFFFIYSPISFKLGMLIDSVELYILICL